MIGIPQLGDAFIRFESMTLAERERVADEVHAQQPNLLYSVLLLPRYGVTLQQVEVVLNVLLVFFVAIRDGRAAWLPVSDDLQERCLARVCARARFLEGLTPAQQTQATTEALADHPQKVLLAYVFGKLGEHDLLGVKTEPEKMLLLAALNLVECIAETLVDPATSAAQRPRSSPKGKK